MADELVPFGDRALLVRFAQRIDPTVNLRVHAIARVLREWRAKTLGGLGEPVAGYASLLVPFDPLVMKASDVEHVVREALAEPAREDAAAAERVGPTIDIGVTYGGEAGPDLAGVAQLCGLSQAQVVDLHASVVYRAYLLGFAPGFAYLGELPPELELPRRATPRPRVPAGSVAIAGRQTAIYPLATPGGWHLIGRTDALLWDVEREPPALITAGASVRFVPA